MLSRPIEENKVVFFNHPASRGRQRGYLELPRRPPWWPTGSGGAAIGDESCQQNCQYFGQEQGRGETRSSAAALGETARLG